MELVQSALWKTVRYFVSDLKKINDHAFYVKKGKSIMSKCKKVT